MTEATAAQFALTIIACSYTVWLAICLRQTRKELNDLKSRMAKPGDVSRLIEQYERDLAKGEVLVPKGDSAWSSTCGISPCVTQTQISSIELPINTEYMEAQSSTTYFGGGDFGGSGAGDSYGSSDGGGSSSND